MNRRMSVVSRHDLAGPGGQEIVDSFNRRLTRRMTVCRVGLSQHTHGSLVPKTHELCLRGGVKVNFAVHNPLTVTNRVEFDGHNYDFLTELKFSKNAAIVVQMCSHETVSDLLSKVKEKFNIIDGVQLYIYERELSVTQQDIFFQKLEDAEKPMEIFFLWRVNNEKKSMILTDHDPNENRYDFYTMEELDVRLKGLEEEELEKIQQIESKYALAKIYIEDRLSKEK